MKTKNISTQGIALVIVLAMLVLLSGLLIAFFSSATTERSASQASSYGIDARQVADSTVNLVISQIREATSGLALDTTWASQPGALWNFDGTKANAVFKLYSADEMQVKGSPDTKNPDFFAKDVADPTTLPLPVDYVDLNERVFVKNGSNYIAQFPIVDPSARLTAPPRKDKAEDPELPGSEPILFGKLEIDTPLAQRPLVEGFDCSILTAKDPSGIEFPVLPLPVKWMYVLKDGTMGTMKTLMASTTKPSKINPVVARTAFWTDDESSKVNINTASEGTFWDTPSYVGFRESGNVTAAGEVADAKGAASVNVDIYGSGSLNLAVSQPVAGEFQRYPGHPATTCLSPILRSFWMPDPNSNKTVSENELSFRELLSGTVPYITFKSTSKSATAIPFYKGGDKASTGTASNDSDRLYASVDELMFRPDRSAREKAKTAGTGSADPSDLPQLDFTPARLEKVRFFLTANSRAPELNLFGTPRVAIWPTAVTSSPAKRTPFDELFDYVATVGGKRFSFERSDNGSLTADFPGTPGPSGLGRNVGVFTYLQDLTNMKIPGFGSGTFLNKYGVSGADPDKIPERDQILTEIFDYIRCTNIVDGSVKGAAAAAAFQPFALHYWPPRPGEPAGIENSGRPQTNAGQVVPIRTSIGGKPAGQGFGRFATISEVAVLFYPTSTVGVNMGETLPPLAAGSRRMRAILLLEMTTPAMGYPSLKEDYSVKMKVINQFKIKLNPAAGAPTDVEIGFRNDVTNIVEVDAASANGRGMMAPRGFNNTLQYFKTLTDRSLGTKQLGLSGGTVLANQCYPFISRYIDVPAPAANAIPMFGISGGSFQFEISMNGAVVQTIDVVIPQVNNPSGFPAPPPGPAEFSTRMTNIKFSAPIDTAILPGDVVRSVAIGGPTMGDIRLVAGRAKVPASYFVPPDLSLYHRANVAVHHLVSGHGEPYLPITIGDATWGKLIPGQAGQNNKYKPQDLPKVVTGLPASADWDRGISKQTDGPWINKPDEGNVYFDPSQSNHLRLPYFQGPKTVETGQSYFSPNRLLSSPVMFGSLPTGLRAGIPWKTLLFHPNFPAHPSGGVSPPDHLLLDLFSMPVVEPYAVSEPLSTAGKLNMNYQIAPFSYKKDKTGKFMIRRDTALRAAFKAVKMLAILSGYPEGGHGENSPSPLEDSRLARFDIAPYDTLKQFQTRFEGGGLFKSESEICNINLQPIGPNRRSMNVPDWSSFWSNNYALTGDNQRERPYSLLYPRLTTKSNVFTVHMRSQSITLAASAYDEAASANGVLKVLSADDLEKKVLLNGEYRGSSIIERFIDPNDPAIVKAYQGVSESSVNLDKFYRFRVVNTKRFNP